MGTVSVRYFVDDVDTAIGFYRDLLGFEVVMHPAPPFAMLSRGDLRLLLSAPGGGRRRVAAALLAHELVGADERPDRADHGDGEAEAQRDHAGAHGGEAQHAHRD